MEKARVGIIGCGNISGLYFENLIHRYGEEIEVVSCTDIVSERACQSAQKYCVKKAYSLEEMLSDDDVEIVVNITVPLAHTEISRAALNAGKHVYSEKPLALSLEEAKATIDLAESKGLMIACAPDTFLGSGIQTCRQLLDEGWIGRPIAGTANFAWPGHEIWHPSPEFYYKLGGGPMMDMGPYYLTSLVAMLGSIDKITAMTRRARDTRMITSMPLCGKKIEVDVPTHYAGIVEFKNGAVVNLTMSFDVWNSTLPNMEIYGTRGTLFCPNPDLFSGPVKLLRSESIIDSLVGVDTMSSGLKGNPFDFSGFVKEIPLRYHDPKAKIRGLGVLDMIHAIRQGRKCRISHDLIYHVTEALTAFEKASDGGYVYKMQSDCERPAGMPLDYDLDKLD